MYNWESVRVKVSCHQNFDQCYCFYPYNACGILQFFIVKEQPTSSPHLVNILNISGGTS